MFDLSNDCLSCLGPCVSNCGRMPTDRGHLCKSVYTASGSVSNKQNVFEFIRPTYVHCRETLKCNCDSQSKELQNQSKWYSCRSLSTPIMHWKWNEYREIVQHLWLQWLTPTTFVHLLFNFSVQATSISAVMNDLIIALEFLRNTFFMCMKRSLYRE